MRNLWRRILKNVSWKMLLLLLGLALFLYLSIIGVAGPRSLYEYFDGVILFYLVGVTVVILACSGMGKDFRSGIRMALSGKVENVSRMELQKAINAVRFAKGIVFPEAGIMVAVCYIDILYRMNLSTIGPSLALMGLSLLYAAIFALLMTVAAGKLEAILVAYMEESDGEEAIPDGQTLYFKLRAMGLTDREAEVARLVSCEMTNKEIAQMLYISDTTVKKHITHILEKTKQEDREKLTGLIRGL